MDICKVCGYKWHAKNSAIIKCLRCKSVAWQFGNNLPCKCCGKTVMIPDIHHINGNHKDNRLENLHPLCLFCHYGVHSNIRCFKEKRTGSARGRNSFLIYKYLRSLKEEVEYPY